MAQLTIRLEIDAKTGKKNVIIGYRSDEDALPMEHEEDHRQLVERLIEGGVLQAAELGQIVVQREQEVGQGAELEPAAAQQERRSLEQDS